MDRDQFRSLLRDALINIHDYVVLEKNPLNDLIPRPDPSVRRAENLRRFIWDGIELLKPKTSRTSDNSFDWRYYLVLSGRYIDGASVLEMQKRLALGERQERRLHGRASSALEDVLWGRLFPDSASGEHLQQGGEVTAVEKAQAPVHAGDHEEDLSFPVSIEPLHLGKVINETTALFLPQLQARGGELSVHVPANLPMVQADRIILRQILLHLFNRILQSWAGDEVFIYARRNHQMVVVEIVSLVEPSKDYSEEDLRSNKLVTYWLERLSAHLFVDPFEETEDVPSRIQANFPELETPLQIRYMLELPLANQAKILVVDDHEPAIRIIQRYLSQTNIQVVGASDPTQILSLARTLKPKAVLLDVMMPAMDGWEILQKLKSDPETHNIPVIICSVWEQPDLAYSLGANGFLKKPISQAELLDELARSHLLEISDESLPKDS